MVSIGKWLLDPEPDAVWQIWYEDTFDRETPRRVEVSGEGLALGLTELWSRHLFEAVRADGSKGFCRFNMWWVQVGKSIVIKGAWGGMVKIRNWVYGDKQDTKDGDLLMRLASIHGCLVVEGGTSEDIFIAAEGAENREDFENQLASLEEKVLRKFG